jgi:hypothetical protein
MRDAEKGVKNYSHLALKKELKHDSLLPLKRS